MKCPKCGYDGNKPHQKRCLICDAPLIPGQPTQTETPKEETTEASDSPLVESAPASTHNIEEVSESVQTEASQPSVGNLARQIPQQQECPRCHSLVPLDVKFCPECGCNMLQPEVSEPSIEMERPRPERPRPSERVKRKQPKLQTEQPSNLPEEDITVAATQAESDGVSSQHVPDDMPDDSNHGYGDAVIDYEDNNPQVQKTSISLTIILVIVAAIVSIIIGAMLHVTT